MQDPYTVLLPETQVNTTESGAQEAVAVSAFANGGWLSTVLTRPPGIYTYDVIFRKYAADGTPTSDEIYLDAPDKHSLNDVATLPDGGWVILWRISDFAGSNVGIGSQRFDANGVAQGDPVHVNTDTAGVFNDGRITVLEDGGWITSWSSTLQASSGQAVYFQRFASDGSMVGVETKISSLAVQEANADIEVIDDGGFVTLWTTSDSVDGATLFLKKFGADGVAVTSDIQVNSTVGENYNNPQVAALEDGGWIVTWSPQPPTAPGGPPITTRAVYFQRFDADGEFVGGETQVNPPSLTYSFNGTVTGLQSGGWIIAWNELNGFGGQLDSYSQRYDADGTPMGDALLVNTHLPGNQSSPNVEQLANGDIVFSWSSEGQDLSSYGAFQTLLELNFDGKTVVGTEIAEALVGDGGDDNIMGLGGDDTIWASLGSDTVDGGEGHDSINGGDDDDEISGGLGNDYLAGDGGSDTINGGDGNDTIRGFTGHDYIDGGDKKDVILGDNGNDTLFGGHGNDAIRGGNGHDSIEGGIGNDRLFGGNSGDDTILGGEGRDLIRAGNHHDLLDGGAGNDTMIAGSGFDTLIGGAGDDVLTGAFNADRFVFADFHGDDTVTDFDANNNAEKIDFSQLGSINSFDEVFNVGTGTGAASQVGLNVVIVTGADSSVVLENVLLSDLDTLDFIF